MKKLTIVQNIGVGAHAAVHEIRKNMADSSDGNDIAVPRADAASSQRNNWDVNVRRSFGRMYGTVKVLHSLRNKNREAMCGLKNSLMP